jgi:hypothetical protein
VKGVLADCKHAIRLYLRTPVSSSIAVVVLAVGMAFVGAFLSLYVDLVLRPHPGFEQSSRIATIGQQLGLQRTGPGLIGIPHALVERIAEEMTSIEAAASFAATSTLVGAEAAPEVTGMVSAEFFSGLRPRLVLGRGFRPQDHVADAEPIVVLSNRYWQQRFNGDRNILGSYLEVSRNPAVQYRGPPDNLFSQVQPEMETAQFQIVGVVADTASEIATVEPSIWLPLESVWPLFAGVPEALPVFSATGTYVRLAPGVAATAVANELRARYDGPDSFRNRIPGTQLDAIGGIVRNLAVQRDAKRQLELFLGASVLIALVAAANVSLFLLARAPGRRRELGIRMAVGAPIGRLARQLATEGGLLVVVAAGLGLLGSVWLSFYLRSLALLRDAEWRDVTLLDWRVLGLAGVVLLVLTLFVSLAPVPGLKRLSISASSQAATARASLAQRIAGTAQIVVAGTLGAAAIAFGWHLGALTFGNAGYETSNRYIIDGATDIRGLDREQIFVKFARRREAIESIPGVSAVAYGSPVPGGRSGNLIPLPVPISNPEDPANLVKAYLGSVDDRFIDLLGLRLLHGRAPEFGETTGVVVNQALARALWGRDDVVGERLPGDFRWGNTGADIIGVLEDLSYEHPSEAPPPYVFLTMGSPGANALTLVESELTAADLRFEFDLLDATGALEVEVRDIRPLENLRDELIPADRARGYLTITSAILVVFLAAFGFYGTQRFLVSAGRREYAIRASLGAGPRALGRLVFVRGLLLGLPGIAVGSFLAFIVVAFLRDDIVSRDISPGIVTMSVVAALVLLILSASVGPSRQAGRTQPAPLLRED